jgi:hypothetical protein
MWGSTLWQKFVICFTITFFTIWISTLATWTTILAARQEGQGAQSAPFSKVACGVLQDEAKVKATKTAPKGSTFRNFLLHRTHLCTSPHHRLRVARRYHHDRRLQVAPHFVWKGANWHCFCQRCRASDCVSWMEQVRSRIRCDTCCRLGD